LASSRATTSRQSISGLRVKSTACRRWRPIWSAVTEPVVARIRNLKRLAAAPYELVTKNIDSMLVQLDGVKVKLENPQLVEKAKALKSTPNKAAKPVKEENPSDRLKPLLIAPPRPASRTLATRWTTLTTAFRALARGAAACRAPAVIVVVGDR